jgi:hypothetical protein
MQAVIERRGPTLGTAFAILAALGIVSSLGVMLNRRTAPRRIQANCLGIAAS